MNVTLNFFELTQGATAGAMRQIYAMSKGLKGKFAATRVEDWGQNIEGALAERAVAKALNLCQEFHKNGDGDLRHFGKKLEVRQTRYKAGKLTVYDYNDPQSIYILVVGDSPTFTIAGWGEGVEVMQPEFWAEPPTVKKPAFWVPQEALRPISELAELAF